MQNRSGDVTAVNNVVMTHQNYMTKREVFQCHSLLLHILVLHYRVVQLHYSELYALRGRIYGPGAKMGRFQRTNLLL